MIQALIHAVETLIYRVETLADLGLHVDAALDEAQSRALRVEHCPRDFHSFKDDVGVDE